MAKTNKNWAPELGISDVFIIFHERIASSLADFCCEALRKKINLRTQTAGAGCDYKDNPNHLPYTMLPSNQILDSSKSGSEGQILWMKVKRCITVGGRFPNNHKNLSGT